MNTHDDPNRGTGRTTRQIQGAPRGAIFIWPVAGTLSYPKALGRKLDRDDLEYMVLDHYLRVAATIRAPVIVDHATWVLGKPEQLGQLSKWLSR